MQTILTILFAFILIAGGVFHIVKPDFYEAITPDFVSLSLANLVAAIVEIVIGLALLLPKYRKVGALAFTLLMLVFLPIHIWDLFKDVPAVGSKTIAIVRLALQFLMIYGGYWLYKKSK